MSESSINNAITTATEVVAAPLHWLDVLVTSLLSGAVALAVGLLAIIVISLFAWWRPISAAPFMRWVMAAATGAVAAAITDEMARLAWLDGRIAVPRIVHFERSHNAAYLVTTALPGRSAYDLLVERPAERLTVARALGTFLREWHALPTVDCPFRSDRELRLAAARRRYAGEAVIGVLGVAGALLVGNRSGVRTDPARAWATDPQRRRPMWATPSAPTDAPRGPRPAAPTPHVGHARCPPASAATAAGYSVGAASTDASASVHGPSDRVGRSG